MSLSKNNISRRSVLRGLGTVVALPALEAMGSSLGPSTGPSRALSASSASDAPKRMAFLYVPNGMHMDEWTPSSEGASFELKNILRPVEKYQSKMNVLSGLTLNGARPLGDGGGDHARSVAAYLTGAHPRKTGGKDIKNGVSVDQLAADGIGHLTRFSSMELGTEASSQSGRCDSGYSCAYSSNMSWRNESTPVAKEINPAAVFDRLFGNGSVKEKGNAKLKREKYKMSVLDFVLEDAKSLQKGLGSTDRKKLDEYLFAVRQVERQIVGVDKLHLPETDVPDYPRPAGVPREFESHVKLMMDLMVLAFQTDSTRVQTFMFTNAGSNRSYKSVGANMGHHDSSHHGDNRDKKSNIEKINVYHATLLAHFLQRLDSVQEGDSTLLDNSIIVYGSGIGDGNRHNHDNLPVALFGSGGKSFETGRHIRYRKETPLTNLYLTMLDQVGVKIKSLGDSTGKLEL
ncbi:DUF1552 domain-containing protein [Mariniblastus sp.]|nr:DUF1552 domain-containing protein [Mariniblastus sp.]MDB4756014.1 DUF1552 domain-containing protein [Mariniblastus sp.]